MSSDPYESPKKQREEVLRDLLEMGRGVYFPREVEIIANEIKMLRAALARKDKP